METLSIFQSIQTRPILIVIILQLALSGCGRKPEDSRVDAGLIDSALSRFSAALAQGDTSGMKNLCGAGFVLLEDGKYYDVATMSASVAEVLRTGTMSRRLVDVKTEINGDAAWSHYRVEGEFRMKENTVPLSLLETAALTRKDGTWKIMQVSTMVAAR